MVLKLTREQIEAEKTRGGGFAKRTLVSWGVPYPPPRGWIDVLLRGGDFAPLVAAREAKKAEKKTRQAAKRQANKAEKAANVVPFPGKPRRPNGKADRVKRQQSKHVPSPVEKAAFYDGWAWRTLRTKVLKRHGNACLSCGARPGQVTVGGEPVRIVVDHIRPLSRYWHLRLDPENVQPLCDECNQGKGAWDETDYRTEVTV